MKSNEIKTHKQTISFHIKRRMKFLKIRSCQSTTGTSHSREIRSTLIHQNVVNGLSIVTAIVHLLTAVFRKETDTLHNSRTAKQNTIFFLKKLALFHHIFPSWLLNVQQFLVVPIYVCRIPSISLSLSFPPKP